MAKFDLHLHSNNSDGSASVHELVEEVKKNGIKIFALTDHDTVAGIKEAERLITDEIQFIKGVELTCKAKDVKCHILGYNIDADNKDLKKLIDLGKKLRKQKLETRIKYLKNVWNIELSQEELNWLYSRQSVVKTHLANILVNRGLANNNIEAMKKYLDECETGNTKFDGEIAIQTIDKAGGTPIWAHPLGGEGEKHLSEEEFIPNLETMINCGIKGLECYYSRYTQKEAEFLVHIAKQYNLLITGGSDWHGTNKDIPIGLLSADGLDIDSSLISVNKM